MQVRDDIRVEPVPAEDVHRGRCVALAYSSAFGGAGIQLTPRDALGLAEALSREARRAMGLVAPLDQDPYPRAGELATWLRENLPQTYEVRRLGLGSPWVRMGTAWVPSEGRPGFGWCFDLTDHSLIGVSEEIYLLGRVEVGEPYAVATGKGWKKRLGRRLAEKIKEIKP